MIMMIKNLWKNYTNPLLFYADSEGNSVFRLFANVGYTGFLYKIPLSKPKVGSILEYRFSLDKKYKIINVLILLLCYFVLLSIELSFKWLIIVLFMYISLNQVSKWCFNQIYKKFLIKNLGAARSVEFSPRISNEKAKKYSKIFVGKFLFWLIVFCCFFMFSQVLLNFAISQLNSKDFDKAAKTINLYTKVYPKTFRVYEMRATARYGQKDYTGALKDYIKVLDNKPRKVSENDYVLLANLLVIKTKESDVNSAIDRFNDYLTRKKLSIIEQSKFLWIKSMFSIEHHIYAGIESDYDDLLASLSNNDLKNKFYILSDKAYLLYLMKNYSEAIKIYNVLITYANSNDMPERNSLYAERAFAKMRVGDGEGANLDIESSNLKKSEILSYEPVLINSKFVIKKF